MPPSSCHNMTDCVSMVVLHAFRIACCARTEIHQHRLGNFGRASVQMTTCFFHTLVKVFPTIAISVYNQSMFKFRAAFHRLVYFHSNIIVGRANNSFYMCLVKPVNQILFHKLVCGRHGYRTQFMKCHHTKPKLIMSF